MMQWWNKNHRFVVRQQLLPISTNKQNFFGHIIKQTDNLLYSRKQIGMAAHITICKTRKHLHSVKAWSQHVEKSQPYLD